MTTEFACCVRRLGGHVLEDTLSNLGTEVADYWFPHDETIVELKSLKKDLGNDAMFKRRVQRMTERWILEGRLPPQRGPQIRVNLRELPANCAGEFMHAVKRRLESVVAKANRQIRATKRFLDVEAKGLLIVANDHDLIYTPDMFMQLVDRVLRAGRSSITGVTYFSANRLVTVPGLPLPALFWINGVVSGRERPSGDLCRRLNAAWVRRHSELLGQPIAEMDLSGDPSMVAQIQFVDVAGGIYQFR